MALGARPGIDQTQTGIEVARARQQVTLYPDSLPSLEWLAARWPLATLSNGNADIHRIGLGPFFRHTITARTADVAKPDARIFHAAAQALGVPPEAVLHVGDDATLDVTGAQDAGMQAVWINREEALWPHEGRAPELECYTLDDLCRATGLGRSSLYAAFGDKRGLFVALDLDGDTHHGLNCALDLFCRYDLAHRADAAADDNGRKEAQLVQTDIHCMGKAADFDEFGQQQAAVADQHVTRVVEVRVGVVALPHLLDRATRSPPAPPTTSSAAA